MTKEQATALATYIRLGAPVKAARHFATNTVFLVIMHNDEPQILAVRTNGSATYLAAPGQAPPKNLELDRCTPVPPHYFDLQCILFQLDNFTKPKVQRKRIRRRFSGVNLV